MKNLKEKIKKITDIFKKIGSDADNDWKITFSLTVLLILFLSIFGAIKVTKSQILKKVEVENIQATITNLIDEKELDEIIDRVKVKKMDYIKIEDEGIKIIDPFW